jgi:putative transposase
MSNHYHLVVTDMEGRLPVFMHWLNEYVAKCTNSSLGRWESFWSPGSYSQVSLTDAEDVLAKLVYTFTNPVAACLVPSFKQWPGAMSRPGVMGEKEVMVDRPEGFFRANGPVPPRVPLKLTVPPAFSGHPNWLSDLQARITALEADLQAAFIEKRKRFLGRRRVLEQSPFSRPRNDEPRRGLNPRVAARDKWRRIQSLQRLKRFLVEYRTSWRSFANGDRSVRFPFGTYAMRVRFQVLCCGP